MAEEKAPPAIGCKGMKQGRIVPGWSPRVFYFWSAWKQDGKAVVLKDDRCRWDVSGDIIGLQQDTARSVLAALVAQAEADGLSAETIDWLKDRTVGPRGEDGLVWSVRHDTGDEDIQATIDAWREAS